MTDETFGEIRPISAAPVYAAAMALVKHAGEWYRLRCLSLGICPFCRGDLSGTRIQNGRRLRHCYSCHFEFEEAIA